MVRKLVENILIRVMVFLAAAGIWGTNTVLALPEEDAQPPEQTHRVRIDHKFHLREGFMQDRLKFTYIDSTWSLKFDMVPGDQHEYAVDINVFNNKKHHLLLTHMGTLKAVIDDELLEQTYDFAVHYTRKFGDVPLLGPSSITFYHFSTLKKGVNIEQKYRIGFTTRHLDFVYQLVRQRGVDKLHANYYFIYHIPLLAICISKAYGHKASGSLVIKKPPVRHVSLWEFARHTDTLNIIAYSAFKNGDPNFYHQFQADLGSWLVFLGDKRINQPIFPSFLAFGDISHSLQLTRSSDELRLASQLGFRVTPRFGVGGGVLVKPLAPEPLKISPIISVFIKIPIMKQIFHIEGKYEDKILSFYAYLQIRF